MFDPIENGSVYEIPDNAFGFIYKCHLPPVGYGVNSITGELGETDIIKRSDIPEEQYWERYTLPKDYKERRNIEKERQKYDKYYTDPYLEEIRKREWKRRLYGVWFWNYNPKKGYSELVYITGTHYLYITYWKFQGRFMDFRINDMELWYVVKYIETDPNSLGINEITKRKLGKCFGKDTPIRMYDGSVKMVQDIMEGELVMGDDSSPRVVSGVTSGRETLYRIKTNKGNGFVCNESHILALKWNGVDKPNYRGWKNGDLVNIPLSEYIELKQWEKDHLVMYKKERNNDFISFGFEIENIGEGEYFGFAVDKNHLFLLEDGTVVHNTARLGCWLYDRTSKPPFNQHAGLQSKADDDAEEVMKKAIVQPWQKLPDFYRPVYDTMKGDDPNELRFFNPSRRGSSAESELDEEALESWIDYGASGEGVYDGPELDSYGSDESGKTKRPVSIKERQSTVRFCAEIDGDFKRRDCKYYQRKQWYTTTVEIEPGEEDNYEFQEMTAMSNPLERDDNGRTMTGLYTYFLPAQKGMYFDKYGYPDENRATIYLLNTRRKLEQEGKTRELSSFKRKNPMTFKEAFSADGSHTLYDPEKLSEQLDNISWRNDLTERGNLKWYKDSPFTLEIEDENGEKKVILNQVIWEPNINGKFEKVTGWWPTEPNKIYQHNSAYLPNNKHLYRIGYDTFKYDKTKDKRRSNAAAFVYQMKDQIYPSKFEDMFVLRYCARPDNRMIANMDVLMMCWLCGCQVLVERNAGDHYKEHFQLWNCYPFLMQLPGETEPGITTDGAGNTTQTICNYTEQYINEDINKVFFKTLIRKETGWLGFKVEDTQKFDEPMAAGITLIAVKGKKYVLPTQQRKDIENYLKYNKAV